MNNYASISAKQNWEPEELDFWQLDDFVDVLQNKEVSILEQEFSRCDSFH